MRRRSEWLPAIYVLFRGGAIVTSKQIAVAFGMDPDSTACNFGDYVTRIRAAGLPLRVVGFAPGSKQRKLYAMEVPEWGSQSLGQWTIDQGGVTVKQLGEELVRRGIAERRPLKLDLSGRRKKPVLGVNLNQPRAISLEDES